MINYILNAIVVAALVGTFLLAPERSRVATSPAAVATETATASSETGRALAE